MEPKGYYFFLEETNMKLKERISRIKDWCIEHKATIVFAAVSVAGCGVLCYGVKKINDISNAHIKELGEEAASVFEDLEGDMFVNGVKKQFLNGAEGYNIAEITDDVRITKSIVQDSNCLCALRNADKVLIMAQDVPATRGIEIMEAVRNDLPGIDDLEIWIGGTIKE